MTMTDTAQPRKTRLVVVALMLIGLIAVSAWGAVSYRDNPLTRRAQDYTQTVATTAAATYVTLRTLNAFLSTAQELEVGVGFIASGSAQPMKVLEPIDDTIERIAGLVFGIMVTTGILSVALGPVSAVGFGMMGAAAALWLVANIARGRARPRALPRRLAWYGAFLGLALPIALVGASQLAGHLTDNTYAVNRAVIAEITQSLDAETPGDEGGGFSLSIGAIDDYRQLAVNVWNRADDLISALVALLAVFVFNIFILPGMLIGGLFMTVRYFARAAPAHPAG
ncbi:hypothetical protein [Oceaniglobus indicus]|uniref:hypothetical protein n=1 Tax=Oceaniglobus indicus TaxID=2047749 RepID=UPI000C19515D|nr:hypothetical protein [Oceaniglobus indicus]